MPYLKNDVLSTALCFTNYTKSIENLPRFGTKNGLTLPSLAIKYFKRLEDEEDEPIHPFNDEDLC